MAGCECEFVEKPPKAVQSECPICLLVLREPYQATCCGKSFCKECIERIKTSIKSCPTCNDGNFNIFHNKGLQQSLYDFQVYCTHKSKGCEWTGELRELDNHLNSDPPADKSLEGCPFTVINCPLSCAGCETGLCRKDVKAHVNSKLLTHVMTQMKSFEQQLQENHNLRAHLKEDKRQLEQRVTKLEIIVSELDVKNKELDVKNRELEEKVKELEVKQPLVVSESQPGQHISKQQKQPVGYLTGTFKPIGAEFTMTDFEEYKRDNDKWYSPRFYTHPNGYKMCMAVDANGVGDGKGTHISVFVFLMQGEYDDQLKWPFRGDVTIQLLDQEGGSGHKTKTVSYNDEVQDEFADRVKNGARTSSGWGRHRFLRHTHLQPKYLKNDCIKLHVKRVTIW